LTGQLFLGQLREPWDDGHHFSQWVQPPEKLSLRRLSVGDAAALVARIWMLDSRFSKFLGGWTTTCVVLVAARRSSLFARRCDVMKNI